MWLIIVGLLVLNTLVEGLVLSVLWSWFMVSAFGLPPISIPVALGISLLISVATFRVRNEDLEEVETDKALMKSGVKLLCLFIFLGLGWIVHLFV